MRRAREVSPEEIDRLLGEQQDRVERIDEARRSRRERAWERPRDVTADDDRPKWDR